MPSTNSRVDYDCEFDLFSAQSMSNIQQKYLLRFFCVIELL